MTAREFAVMSMALSAGSFVFAGFSLMAARHERHLGVAYFCGYVDGAVAAIEALPGVEPDGDPPRPENCEHARDAAKRGKFRAVIGIGEETNL